MPDVPRASEPSDAERLATLLTRMTPGGIGGGSKSVGPVMPRDQARAQVIGGGADEDSLDARESRIDQFTVTGTATSTFQLTFSALDDSWNVTLNGVTLTDTTEYAISGQTLTVITPADLFLGASGTDPWLLQVQYDYLGAVPTTPAAGGEFVGVNSTSTFTNAAYAVPLPAHAAGDLLVVAIACDVGVTPPAGWTNRISQAVPVGGSGFASFLHVFTKVAGGSEPDPTFTPAGLSWVAAVAAAYRGVTYGAVAGNQGTSSTTHNTPGVAGTGRIVYIWAISTPADPTLTASTKRTYVAAGSAYSTAIGDLVGAGTADTATIATAQVWGGVSMHLADA